MSKRFKELRQSPWLAASRLRVSIPAVFLVSVLLLPACATSQAGKKIQAFSKATSVAANNTGNAYETIDNNYFRAHVASLIVDYDENGFNPNAATHLLPDEDIKVRKEVLDGLEQYADKLTEIMSNKQLDEFDAQTVALGQSLVNLKNGDSLKKFAGGVTANDIKIGSVSIGGTAAALNVAAVPLTEFGKLASGVSNEQVNLLTAGINALGNFLIRAKRDKKVKEIVREMNEPIKAICALLIADIGQPPDEAHENGHGLRNISWRQYDKLLRNQDTFIRKNKDKLDPRTKAEEIAKLPDLVADRQKTDSTLKATQDALKKLAQTHEQLVTAFDKSSPSLDKLIGQLISEGKRIKDFYDSLGKK